MAVTRDEIADVVEQHIARYGYLKTTVDEIASQLGISKKTLYQHFETKQDMYAYVVARIAEKSRVDMARAVARLGTYREKTMKLVRLILSQAREQTSGETEADWGGERIVAASAFSDAYGRLLQELLEQGIAAGEFAVRDATLAQRMVSAMLTEYSLTLREEPEETSEEELTAAIFRFLG